jgi:hypothetical protein
VPDARIVQGEVLLQTLSATAMRATVLELGRLRYAFDANQDLRKWMQFSIPIARSRVPQNSR